VRADLHRISASIYTNYASTYKLEHCPSRRGLAASYG